MSASSLQDAAITWCIRIHEDLSASEQAELEAWLVDRPDHQAALDEALALWGAIGDSAEAPEIVTLRHDALGGMQRAGRRRWIAGVPRRRNFWRGLAAAALLLAVALGSMLIWRQDGRQHYDTAIGERRVIALADGSRLSLDADTAVTVAYSDERRSLTLEHGRARFKVAKDPLRPFAVRSRNDLIVATGTEFSVEKLSGETRVALFEGHVAVMRDLGAGMPGDVAGGNGRELAPDRALKPGMELRLPTLSATGTVRPISADEDWETGQLSFEKEDLRVAAERMNRYAKGRRIEISPDLGQLRVSGVFNAGDLSAFAQAVSTIFPVRISVEGAVVRILPRTPASTSTRGQAS